ncbi:MAG: hypothetical protein A2W33_04335 [Chloroflexi bacterium RBG_16_52_11]|nr:MAG: hypothetical protein A2W33_04335 [Chloroflexi bacterium RBG_16_52_11]
MPHTRYLDEEIVPFDTFIGKTFTSVENTGLAILFTAPDYQFALTHDQHCCEDVRVHDVNGDLSDLVDVPIEIAEESSYVSPGDHRIDDPSGTPCDPLDEDDSSYTWTFYRLGTSKGPVIIRFYGTSNGYYSERVDLVLRKPGGIFQDIIDDDDDDDN